MEMADTDSPEIRHRHTRLIEATNSSGQASRAQLNDSDVYYPSDDNHGFFAKVSPLSKPQTYMYWLYFSW